MEVSLDHIGHLVDSLDDVAAQLVAAGFQLTPPVQLARGGGEPTGGVQQTFVTASGYVEVQELAELGLDHPLEHLWEFRPVTAVVAWSTDDVSAAVDAARRAGHQTTDPVTWARDTPDGEARFSFASLVPSPASGARPGPLHVIVQHHDKDRVTASSEQPNSMSAIIGYRTASRLVTALDLSVAPADLAEVTAPVDTVIVRADDTDRLLGSMSSIGIEPTDPSGPQLAEAVATLDARALLGVFIEVCT
ncbi:VOC family protein [Ilumatobacter coccineus]|uniref:Glyoxalase-like domain-containing protein n=1 Tax=Ilumatobacter coccineus (strain NBRC 103263 / KCTC 29153 / YM16-304) TaxID=1313172 RepID=A0A6C7EH19_ILUCY|nr:VOC family protein [Ilumatobacter coccineus]BAN04275.1 hypothetical protein YM304_39610 [Ilumatobacter coccineus YM16-304]